MNSKDVKAKMAFSLRLSDNDSTSFDSTREKKNTFSFVLNFVVRRTTRNASIVIKREVSTIVNENIQ